jgi:hypothetical protein
VNRTLSIVCNWPFSSMSFAACPCANFREGANICKPLNAIDGPTTCAKYVEDSCKIVLNRSNCSYICTHWQTRQNNPGKGEMKHGQFAVSRVEARLISKITRRAIVFAAQQKRHIEFQELEMDITACHCNGCPIDLEIT